MKTAVFSTHSYDRRYLEAANDRHGHELVFLEPRLTGATAVLAKGHPAVCAFVNDELDSHTLRLLAAGGTRLVALRSAGFSNVDLEAAAQSDLRVVHVPSYSPHAVAEHAVGLILALNRKIHRAYMRVRDGDFSLDGLLGFDLSRRTVGIIGTGVIGTTVAQILQGFGCRLLAHDPFPNDRVRELGGEYVDLPALFAQSDIVTLHAPLLPETYHLIDRSALAGMKPGVMLINTSRGALVDSIAVVDGLKTGRVGYLGLDVYEEETALFYRDLSGQVIQDDVLSRLLTLPNVIITAHQGYFTQEALQQIADTTLRNISEFEAGGRLSNEVRRPPGRDRARDAKAA